MNVFCSSRQHVTAWRTTSVHLQLTTSFTPTHRPLWPWPLTYDLKLKQDAKSCQDRPTCSCKISLSLVQRFVNTDLWPWTGVFFSASVALQSAYWIYINMFIIIVITSAAITFLCHFTFVYSSSKSVKKLVIRVTTNSYTTFAFPCHSLPT